MSQVQEWNNENTDRLFKEAKSMTGHPGKFEGEPVWTPYFWLRMMDGDGGCGMDMGFHLVYNLGRTLFPEGFKVEGRGRNGDASGWDKDGGYALKQRWI